MWELQTDMKIANWYENCKLIWKLQSNSQVSVYSSYVDVCNFHMRHDSGNENLFWNRMFRFKCGVDDENSTKQSLAKPSTIHILIPIPMLKQSDLYFKPRFLCSQVKMAHFCALISQNLHLKTTNINWTTKSSCLGDLSLFGLFG
jgi:hypothetical protein